VPGIYRPRHPERTALYRVLFHNFDRFLSEYERCFEKEYGYFRPIVQEVVERYLDCGNPRSGFARIRCPDCHAEHLLTFSCKTRGFCPSCHAKRLEEWAERVGKYMVRPVLSLDRLLFLDREGKVGYRHGQNGAELETMDYRARSWSAITGSTPTPTGGKSGRRAVFPSP
jgi:ribosomal protein S27E